MASSKLEYGRYKMTLEHLVPESKELFKKNPKGDVSKGHTGASLKGS